ncbi:D-mannonate dehydratase ManD [Brachybacterium massiliense]|uniref:D-mannonate dehydratase ManD n=1 Tax=Brachybacterium massiliense TaxID=1755098 RepID=UPI000B3BB9B1|nr:D-mannonate dehydratase ManD [Brachybacterium massiliense]
MATIQSAEVLVSSPGRNFVTLKISTSDGVVGWGDATVNGRELAVVAYLQEHVCPLLIGRDPAQIEQTWQYLYRGAYWRRGPITMAAIAAVDMCLWDIKGKIAGMPVYQLLGGASRDGLRAYGHASGSTIEEVLVAVEGLLNEGYRAVRVQCAVPGLQRVYGVAHGDDRPTGGDGGALPVVEDWDSAKYLAYIPRVFAAVRERFGPDLPLLHDVHHRLTPNEAGRLGRALEPFNLFWLEDFTPAENQESARVVRSMTSQPLAIGEIFNTVWDYQTLISEQLIDYVRSAVTHAGGISHLRKIAEYAAIYQIKTGFHGPADISPIGQAAALHLGLAIHNFGIQEYAKHPDDTASVFKTTFTWRDGLLHPGHEAGLGVEYDEVAARAYPYVRDYLPVNQLLDGAVHDW